MNCYVCSVAALDRSCTAVAICQQCGAGMCRNHLYTLRGSASIGMAGNISRRHICSDCHSLLIVRYHKPATSQPAQTDARQQWWNRWRSHKEAELPEPQDAVIAVEHFLQSRRHS